MSPSFTFLSSHSGPAKFDFGEYRVFRPCMGWDSPSMQDAGSMNWRSGSHPQTPIRTQCVRPDNISLYQLVWRIQITKFTTDPTLTSFTNIMYTWTMITIHRKNTRLDVQLFFSGSPLLHGYTLESESWYHIKTLPITQVLFLVEALANSILQVISDYHIVMQTPSSDSVHQGSIGIFSDYSDSEWFSFPYVLWQTF